MVVDYDPRVVIIVRHYLAVLLEVNSRQAGEETGPAHGAVDWQGRQMLTIWAGYMSSECGMAIEFVDPN